MQRLPLPSRKPTSWPHRIWDRDLLTIGLTEKPGEMTELILDCLKIIRKHHYYTYRKLTERMRRIVDGQNPGQEE